MGTLRGVRDEPTIFTDAAVVGAIGYVAVLVVVVGAAAWFVVPFVRWWLTSDAPIRSRRELLAALVAAVLLVAFWSIRRWTQTVGSVEAQTAPILRWELLDAAPMIDRVFRVAAVVLTLLLVVAVTQLPAATRRRAWLAAAAGSGVLFVGTAAMQYDGSIEEGIGWATAMRVEPTVAGMALPLALVVVFVVAAWVASTEVVSSVRTDGPGPAPLDVAIVEHPVGATPDPSVGRVERGTSLPGS